ncbi:MAG: hypothetical protein JF632_02255, partial [Acidobacteria bacterium]|nr:hypothetical protein [Acidobacteriota bacterium]
MLFGMKAPVGDAITLPIFAAMTLIDTVVVAFMIFVFLRASRESVRQVFFGGGVLSKEIVTGLVLIPVVLLGTGLLMGVVRLTFPGLHNVKISPFDSFFDTPV